MKERIRNNGAVGLGVLVAALCLQGCTEPQDATVESGPVVAGQPSDATSPAPVVDPPIELTLDERKVILTATSSCNLERAGGQIFSGAPMDAPKAQGALRLSGWVADAEAHLVPERFDIRIVALDGSRAWRIPGTTGGERGDVVTLLGGSPEFAGAGFSINADTTDVPAGTYRLYMTFDSAGQARVCDNGRAVNIL